MKRSLAIPLLSVVVALVLASCAESVDQTTTTEAGVAATTTAVESAVASVETHHPENMGWDLVWSDEFDGAGLDETKWGYEQDCWGGGNQEQQCYTDRTDNTFVLDGFLHIKALEEQFTGLDGSEDWDNADELGTTTLPYTSGRIRTKGKGDWRYGRFEIRAQLPSGQGLWPAIWMLPTDWVYGGWAASGEIDIMEAVNLNTVYAPMKNSVYGTLHFGGEWPSNSQSGTSWQFFDDHPADTFHVYAIEWEEGEVRWYVDDIHFATQRSDGWFTQTADGTVIGGEDPAPFDQAFHLILNVAVGGAWPGPPDEKTVFPQEMLVDYVHVYQCSASPDDGKGCATVADTATFVEGIEPPERLFETALTGEFDLATLGDTMAVYEDDRVFPWDFGSYLANGSLDFELIDTGDADHGQVIQTTFNSDEALIYFQAPVTYDMSDWAEGFVEFDLRVTEPGRASGFVVKVDCVHPCSSGDFPIGEPAVGEWEHYRIPIADLLANGGSTLDLTQVNTPLVIFPAWGNQSGAVMQLDNVVWTR